MVDGDLCLSSDNAIMLKGSLKNVTNPITYDKQPAPSQKICHKNFVETDIRGFGTKVGTYSNYSTIIEAMRPLFQRPEQKAQAEELLLRKKLLREINGQEIDRIKGVEAKGPDKDAWLRYWKIEEDDSEEIKKEKYFHNSLVIAKKPYFFRYLYPELNLKYKAYERSYDEASKCMFRMKLKKLLTKENKTEREKSFIKKYHKFSPVISTDCIMNILCRKIEDTDFNIQYNKNCTSMLPHYDLNEYKIEPEILKEFRDMYRQFCNKKAIAVANVIFEGCEDADYEDIRFGILDEIRDTIKEKYNSLNLTPMEGLTYFYALSQSYASFNWDVAWSIIDEDILECIEEKDALAPVESEDGSEFLGRKFKLMPIPKELQHMLINEETGEVIE